jgi:hypothetical protein
MRVTADIAEEGGDAALAMGWRKLAEERKWPAEHIGRHWSWSHYYGRSDLPPEVYGLLPREYFDDEARAKEYAADKDKAAAKVLEMAAYAWGLWLERQAKAS